MCRLALGEQKSNPMRMTVLKGTVMRANQYIQLLNR